MPGGNGLSFDWSLLDEGKIGRTNSSCQAASIPKMSPRRFAATGAAIVDVSSGVERAPGIKDPVLIRNFIEAAKAAR